MTRTLLKINLLSCVILAGSAGLFLPRQSIAQDSQDRICSLDAGLYYTIKKGDTLWDLSERFFDSPWIWPDLWGKNQDIANPHWIYPGNRIRIYDRKGNAQILETPQAIATEPSTPAVEPQPEYYYYPRADSVGFVRKKPLTPCGAIFKVTDDKEMVSERDIVYVQPKGTRSFKLGDQFTIFRTVDTMQGLEAAPPIGVQHYIVGVLEIVRVAKRFSRAKVLKSYRNIERGDLLTPYTPMPSKIRIYESKKQFSATILASEDHTQLIGDHDLVFIDKGRKAGIKVGQYYSVYRREKGFLDDQENMETLLSPVDIGSILVLHVEDTTATAVVTSSERPIAPGAKLRTPPAL